MLQEVQDLSWKYLRMYPLRDIMWKDIQINLVPLEYDDSIRLQKQILSNTIHHPIVQKYPVTLTYTRLFLKGLISMIEESNQEVFEDLYTTYTKLLSQNASSPHCDDFCYRTYNFSKAGVITVKETCKLICDGTTGMCTWEASHVLADWCCRESHRFQNKRILELGAGLGLLGLAVIQSCKPLSYIFTDLHHSVLKTLKENIYINLKEKHSGLTLQESEEATSSDDWAKGIQVSYSDTDVLIKRLDWERDTCDDDIEVILAADVVYDTDVIVHLVKILKDILSKRPRVVAYIASALRNPATYTFFKDALDCGLHTCTETYHQYQESPSQPPVSITIHHILP
ncbi:protein-lysine N-methyltransferase EEF2KMT-like isoform X2 [Panulirus ornatus]|uniref:protein-lysine N-methyltransferase EEF2KMT-like isoform X2 n=1 Tax=Panulirus ornatus TaxID=150431 RepID=UPI003A85CE88